MDGKLAGILERNDGLCHLNGTDGEPGYYTHSEILDYPSISQVSAVVQQNSFLTIFAVIPRYKGPAKHDIHLFSIYLVISVAECGPREWGVEG